jgi:hypothetical protein
VEPRRAGPDLRTRRRISMRTLGALLIVLKVNDSVAQIRKLAAGK